ncbi:MAG: DsrE family protein [Campylobacterota bacterium]|nr:DsrE family protein [Campylobacterota bacterium]
MAKKNLLIIISTDNVDSIMKFPLLYGGVALPRGYWKRVHVMFWGASIKVAKKNKTVQKKVKEMIVEGVEFSSCIVCAKEYQATKKLKSMGIVCNHTGELLTKALKKEHKWAILTI